jgi:hypothetical protein
VEIEKLVLKKSGLRRLSFKTGEVLWRRLRRDRRDLELDALAVDMDTRMRNDLRALGAGGGIATAILLPARLAMKGFVDLGAQELAVALDDWQRRCETDVLLDGACSNRLQVTRLRFEREADHGGRGKTAEVVYSSDLSSNR